MWRGKRFCGLQSPNTQLHRLARIMVFLMLQEEIYNTFLTANNLPYLTQLAPMFHKCAQST